MAFFFSRENLVVLLGQSTRAQHPTNNNDKNNINRRNKDIYMKEISFDLSLLQPISTTRRKKTENFAVVVYLHRTHVKHHRYSSELLCFVYFDERFVAVVSFFFFKEINLRLIRNLNCLLHLHLYIYEQRKRKKNEKRRRHITFFFFSNMSTRIEQV